MKVIFLFTHPNCVNCEILEDMWNDLYGDILDTAVQKNIILLHVDPNFEASYYYFMKYISNNDISLSDYPILIARDTVETNLPRILELIKEDSYKYFNSFPYTDIPILLFNDRIDRKCLDYDLSIDNAPLLYQIQFGSIFNHLLFPYITTLPCLLYKDNKFYGDDIFNKLTEFLENQKNGI